MSDMDNQTQILLRESDQSSLMSSLLDIFVIDLRSFLKRTIAANWFSCLFSSESWGASLGANILFLRHCVCAGRYAARYDLTLDSASSRQLSFLFYLILGFQFYLVTARSFAILFLLVLFHQLPTNSEQNVRFPTMTNGRTDGRPSQVKSSQPGGTLNLGDEESNRTIIDIISFLVCQVIVLKPG